jgi:hypothetical protein
MYLEKELETNTEYYSTLLYNNNIFTHVLKVLVIIFDNVHIINRIHKSKPQKVKIMIIFFILSQT